MKVLHSICQHMLSSGHRTGKGQFSFQSQRKAMPKYCSSSSSSLAAKSCPTLVTPWTVTFQVPLPMGFSRQEYWSGLPFPSPGDLPDPGIEPGLLHCRKILYQLSYKGIPKNAQTTAQMHSSHTLVMFKILQARLQQYVNCELPDVQAGFRKGRGTRDQIANICWIIEKAREFRKNTYFCFIDYAKAFDCLDHNKLRKIYLGSFFQSLKSRQRSDWIISI